MREFIGTLILDDNNDYIIEDKNLSTYLSSIYNISNWIKIIIENNEKCLVDIQGEFYKEEDQFGIYDWFIDDFCLGLFLHNHTGEELLIHVSRKGVAS